ncbi:MAG: radical SAM protein [Methanomicrobiaceae archaeon]|nr:radical SAM protein [Methanomicrobiaceae archaeon]
MKVIEIFISLQGEGKNQGVITTFVRLSGCNLNCRWCDTPESHSGGTEMSVSGVFEEVQKLGCANVCITGGEPLLSMDELIPLLKILSRECYKVEIETNGTINPAPCMDFASVCMDIKCPSSGEKSDLSLLECLGFDDTVKFVVADLTDCEYAADIIMNREFLAPVFISPVWGSDYGKIAEYVIENRLPVKFQMQLHKIIGVK